MPVKYCSSCGNKISFEIQPPNFCPKCGKQVNAALKLTAPQTQNNEQRRTFYQGVSSINQYSPSSPDLEESEEVNLDLIDQLKASMLRNMGNCDITVTNIPEFRVPLEKIVKEKTENNQ